jgi:hypothetical protein
LQVLAPEQELVVPSALLRQLLAQLGQAVQ